VLWGKVCLHLGLSPLSEEAKKLYHNVHALLFLDVIRLESEKEKLRALGKMLGTYWTRDLVNEMFRAKKGTRAGSLEEIMIPLALWQAPEMGDYLLKLFADNKTGVDAPSWAAKEEVVNCFDLPREKFLEIASLFTGITKYGKSMLG